MIFCVVCVTSQWNILTHSFFMSTIGLMEFSAMTVFLKFLYVLNQIFSLLGRPLHLHHTSSYFVPPFWTLLPCHVPPPIIQNFGLPSPFTEKIKWDTCETTKVNITNLHYIFTKLTDKKRLFRTMVSNTISCSLALPIKTYIPFKY